MSNRSEFSGWSVWDFLEEAYWRGFSEDREDWSLFVQAAGQSDLSERALDSVYRVGVAERALRDSLFG